MAHHHVPAARFFGTLQYIVGQTIAVVIWVTFNVVAVEIHARVGNA